jgi:hypothetical protein
VNRFDVRVWSGFALFVIAVAVVNLLAGSAGVCVVVILTLGILYWADRHGYLTKDVRTTETTESREKSREER